MTFAYPHLLWLLLAIPVLAWLRGHHGKRAAFRYSSTGLMRRMGLAARTRSGSVLAALRWLAVALMIVALARPQQRETETRTTAEGIDIVVAFDMSGSMLAEDFKHNGLAINRIEAARGVLKDFINHREHDRIGLIAFAAHAYIAAPITIDHDFLQRNLERLDPASFEDGTAIGSALMASLNRLKDSEARSRIVILMTDGQNNRGDVPPLTAAEVARATGIKVYTIGVGTRGTAPYPYQDGLGRKRYQAVEVNIDEETLTDISRRTGGKYYRADASGTLRAIYDEIDQFEKTEVEVRTYERLREVFAWWLLPGIALLLIELALGHTFLRTLP